MVRSSGRSGATPARTPSHPSSAIGALTSSSPTQRMCASTVPPISGPRMKPLIPTTIIRVIARMRSFSVSNRRKTSEFVTGAIAAAATPRAARSAISEPDDSTQITPMLISPNAARPHSRTRRRPIRSAADPAVSSRPPKVSE